jgi:hypothetical protein
MLEHPDEDFHRYRKMYKFDEVAPREAALERRENKIVEKLPVQIEVSSSNNIAKVKEQFDARLGYFEGSQRSVEWSWDELQAKEKGRKFVMEIYQEEYGDDWEKVLEHATMLREAEDEHENGQISQLADRIVEFRRVENLLVESVSASPSILQ